MSDDSTTQCLLFPGIFRKPIVAQFDQREGSFRRRGSAAEGRGSTLWVGGWTEFLPSR